MKIIKKNERTNEYKNKLTPMGSHSIIPSNLHDTPTHSRSLQSVTFHGSNLHSKREFSSPLQSNSSSRMCPDPFPNCEPMNTS